MGDGRVEVDTLEEGVDLDGGIGRRREVTLGTLTSGTKTTHGPGVARKVLLVLALELLHEVVHQTVVEVLATKVGVASSGYHLEDAIVDGQQGDIEGAATEVEDEYIRLAGGLLVQAICDGCSGLLHLDEHHGGDLLGGEGLLLTLVLDLDPGDVAIARDQLEWPVLHVGLDNRVGGLAADEALGVEDGVDWVHRTLVLGGIADETLCVGESDVARGGTVTLVVGDDLNAIILPDANATVGGS